MPEVLDVDGIPFDVAEASRPVKDFGEFHAEHRRRLIGLVRYVLKERGHETAIDPEDVVQDTLELAVRNWPRIGRMDKPDKYLRKVAAKRAERALEKSFREISTSDEFMNLLTEWTLGWEQSPDMTSSTALHELLEGTSLTLRQSQVFVMTVEGWTDSEIGELLDMTPATVRSHRRNVKKYFAQEHPDELKERLGVR